MFSHISCAFIGLTLSMAYLARDLVREDRNDINVYFPYRVYSNLHTGPADFKRYMY